MLDRAALAALAAVFVVGCNPPSADDEGAPAQAHEVDTDLEIEVDGVTSFRGGVRLTATMVDGSADVSIVLADSCHEEHEGHGAHAGAAGGEDGARPAGDLPEVPIGRGFATRSRVVWSFTADELAVAYKCDLFVRAHGVDPELGRVRRTAKLEVMLGVDGHPTTDGDAPDDERAPALHAQTIENDDIRLDFVNLGASARVVAGRTIVGPTMEDDQARFTIPLEAVAYAAVSRGFIEVSGGLRFATTLRIGSASLDDETDTGGDDETEGEGEAEGEGEGVSESGDEGEGEGEGVNVVDDTSYADDSVEVEYD